MDSKFEQVTAERIKAFRGTGEKWKLGTVMTVSPHKDKVRRDAPNFCKAEHSCGFRGFDFLSQFLKGLDLYLPDSFPCQAEYASNILRSLRRHVPQSESQVDDFPFIFRQRIKPSRNKIEVVNVFQKLVRQDVGIVTEGVARKIIQVSPIGLSIEYIFFVSTPSLFTFASVACISFSISAIVGSPFSSPTGFPRPGIVFDRGRGPDFFVGCPHYPFAGNQEFLIQKRLHPRL